MKNVYLSCLLACWCALAYAQNPDTKKLGIDDLVKENQEQDEVSVASKTLLKVSQAPSVISLVNRRQIDQYGYISMNDALYRQPSFLPTRDYDRRTVSARGNFEGWNANHLLLLIDGVPMNDVFFGTAYTSEITPLVFTKSLEIIRGTGSALYGSNAMNGVVNMRTLRPSDLRGMGEVRFRVGNNGTTIFDAVGGASGQYANVLVGFNRYSTQGEQIMSADGSGRQDSLGIPLKFPTNDKRTSYYFFLKMEGKEKLKGFSMQTHIQQWEFGNHLGFFAYAPDQPENMQNARQVVALRYNSPAKKRLQQEYVLRYQHILLDWNARIYPDSLSFIQDLLPLGVTEHLRSDMHEVFARAQWNYHLKGASSLIAAVENSTLYYDGDQIHAANINLSADSDSLPLTNPNNKMLPQRSSLEWIQKRPVWNVSAFVQYVSPHWKNHLQATIGVRYDQQFFRYLPIDMPDSARAVSRGGFNQISPRISLVGKVNERLTLKLMAGRAFRTPSMGELFGSNSFIFASNYRILKPEYMTSFEFQSDWHINRQITWRGNVFYTLFENQIDYSDDILRNLYSTRNMGIEQEVLLNSDRWSGFFSYAYTQMLSERVLDTLYLEQAGRLTSFPAHALKGGLTYRTPRFSASCNAIYQSAVFRRPSDRTNYIYEDSYLYRPEVLPAWFRLHANISVHLTEQIEVGLWVNNILNTRDYLIRRLPHAFDYQMERRNFLVDIRFAF